MIVLDIDREENEFLVGDRGKVWILELWENQKEIWKTNLKKWKTIELKIYCWENLENVFQARHINLDLHRIIVLFVKGSNFEISHYFVVVIDDSEIFVF